MSKLILYYTQHCHLCEEAEALIRAAGQSENQGEGQGEGQSEDQSDGYCKVEIENDPGLLERYEIYIPVLKRTDNQRELFWPFDALELAAFLETDQ